MAFNIVSGNFVSFAVYSEVTARDQRFFEANEGVTEQQVNDLLAQASQRILSRLKATDWWKEYQFSRDASLENDPRLLPDVNALRIKTREQDWKDLNIYFVMAEYLLPRVADWSNEADVAKIKFNKDQFADLFKELIEDGRWYDFDADGTVERTERAPSRVNLVRVR
jgi:CRISPR/Cas system CSM-associated protein Csm2 small subunit